MLVPESIPVSLSTFVLIAVAEIGDKSQLVCMTLAARHRALPVFLGAALAFALLNALAVAFGTAAATLLPERAVQAIVAILFGAFGIHALYSREQSSADAVVEHPARGVVLTTLLLLFVAEFGDKTQLAVAGLAGSHPPWQVWLGASAALLTISAIGVWAGRTLLQRLPLHWLHRFAGVLFLVFAGLAGWHALA